jgi:hypothetical protein
MVASHIKKYFKMTYQEFVNEYSKDAIYSEFYRNRMKISSSLCGISGQSYISSIAIKLFKILQDKGFYTIKEEFVTIVETLLNVNVVKRDCQKINAKPHILLIEDGLY